MANKRNLFLSDKELHFFNTINKELIQFIVDQTIYYYSISEEHTQSDNLYNESIRKTSFQPVELNARVLYNAPKQSTTKFTMDTVYSMEIYFHLDELYQRNITPRERRLY
jgi:hypothetical protein